MLKKLYNTISLEVTTKCNLSCSNCFALAGLKNYTNMDIFIAKQIAIESFESGYSQFHITGGEPFMWKELPEFLNFLDDLGFESIYINTNGDFLNRNILNQLRNLKKKLIFTVSLNGSEKIHDKIRGKGTQKRAVKGLKSALDLEFNVEVFTTVTKSLIPEFFDFVTNLYKENTGIERIVLIQNHKKANDSGDIPELLDPEEFLQIHWSSFLLQFAGIPLIWMNNDLIDVANQYLGIRNAPLSKDPSVINHFTIHNNLTITSTHSERDSKYGKYDVGKISTLTKVKDIEKSKDCLGCPHIRLCNNYEKFQPTRWEYDNNSTDFYCKRVLDILTNTDQKFSNHKGEQNEKQIHHQFTI